MHDLRSAFVQCGPYRKSAPAAHLTVITHSFNFCIIHLTARMGRIVLTLSHMSFKPDDVSGSIRFQAKRT